ncbi:signal peptidase II [Candidatus Woesearchaeota archaeon]|nr:signal peptidase II [Candidatus Woesearchaeota archaeon]
MDGFKRNSFILISLVLADQALKWLIESLRPELDLKLVTIHSIHNSGASFGMLQGQNTALIFISIIVLGIVMMNVKSISQKQTLPVTMITAGILGNLIDRASRGFVVDFFDLGWFPAFNLADSCISIGVAWLVIILLLEKDYEPRAKAGTITPQKKRKKR